MQQIELITVQRTFYSVDNYIDLVVRKFLGDKISLAHGSSVALLQVRRSPRRVQMMDRHGTLLGIHTSTQHRGRTKDNANVTTVYGIYHRFLCLLVLALLNEAYLIGRDMIVFYQLTLDFRIDIEVSTGLIST